MDSVNAYDEAFVNTDDVVENVSVAEEIKYDDIAPAVEEEIVEVMENKDEVSTKEAVIEEDDEDTEVLELDEIKYSDNNDDVIPEIEPITEVVEEVVDSVEEENNTEEVIEPVVNEVKEEVEVVHNGNKYYNFETRTVIMILISIISFIVAFIFIYQAKNYTDIEDITYNENSIVNYSVCLNENDYYNGDCLGGFCRFFLVKLGELL